MHITYNDFIKKIALPPYHFIKFLYGYKFIKIKAYKLKKCINTGRQNKISILDLKNIYEQMRHLRGYNHLHLMAYFQT